MESQKINTGITPAWAGKRATRRASFSPSWDHPRVGGEKLTWHIAYLLPNGSPPRGRGKDDAAVLIEQLAGITPAWAGKSSV